MTTLNTRSSSYPNFDVMGWNVLKILGAPISSQLFLMWNIGFRLA